MENYNINFMTKIYIQRSDGSSMLKKIGKLLLGKPENPNKPSKSEEAVKPENSEQPENLEDSDFKEEYPQESNNFNKPLKPNGQDDNNIQNGANINQILGGERLPKTGDVGVIHYSIFSMLAISALCGINKKRKNKR